MDQPPALRPLADAADHLRRLDHYDTSEELAAAILGVADAIEQSLRIRLREDPGAPAGHRRNALSPDRLSLDEVVKSLRTRDLISLEAAGTVHEARAAADRAADGDVRAGDGEVVRAAADRLRRELGDGPPSGKPAVAEEPGPAAAESEAAEGAPDGGAPAIASDGARWMRWLAAAVAAAFLGGAAWVAIQGGSEEYEEAVAAFRAGRLDSAAVAFESVLEDRPENVTVMLYLARSYRRLDRPAEAAEVLRRAVEIEPEDADVRRELGHLLLDLGRPASAVTQYERALEFEPEDPLTWAALIRALRILEDPRAEQLLRDAPAEVQAAPGT